MGGHPDAVVQIKTKTIAAIVGMETVLGYLRRKDRKDRVTTVFGKVKVME